MGTKDRLVLSLSNYIHALLQGTLGLLIHHSHHSGPHTNLLGFEARLGLGPSVGLENSWTPVPALLTPCSAAQMNMRGATTCIKVSGCCVSR
jgi:hypothetical protein